MTAILSRAPTGFAGSVSRAHEGRVIQPELIYAAAPPTAYGQFLKYNGNAVTPMAAGDAAGVFAGIAVRSYPVQTTTNAFGAAVPPTTGFIDMLRSGFCTLILALGAAVKGGQVYVVTTAGGTVNVGDVVTSATPAGGGAAVAIPQCTFEGPAGADGIVEVSLAL
jgi:hypothetical protein